MLFLLQQCLVIACILLLESLRISGFLFLFPYAVARRSRTVSSSSFLLDPSVSAGDPFRASLRPAQQKLSSSSTSRAEGETSQLLDDIASKLQVDIVNHQSSSSSSILSVSTNEPRTHALQVLDTSITLTNDDDYGLGLVLTEIAADEAGRGLVLVSQVRGNAARADPPIRVGDMIAKVWSSSEQGQQEEHSTSTAGLNYDRTVQAIVETKEAAAAAAADGSNAVVLNLQLNRLVERAVVQVEVVDATAGKVLHRLEALAGENLRQLLMRKLDIKMGECGGEGQCGRCLVHVKQGAELLNSDGISKKRPEAWRNSCLSVVGHDNKAGVLRISLDLEA